jgi:hypothetical protein
VFSSTHKSTHKGIVISTEAAHGITVSSAAEKSASLPPPSVNHHIVVCRHRFAVTVGIKSGLSPAQTASRSPTEAGKQLILLPLFLSPFFNCHFLPKIACQALKLPNSLHYNNILVEV